MNQNEPEPFDPGTFAAFDIAALYPPGLLEHCATCAHTRQSRVEEFA